MRIVHAKDYLTVLVKMIDIATGLNGSKKVLDEVGDLLDRDVDLEQGHTAFFLRLDGYADAAVLSDLRTQMNSGRVADVVEAILKITHSEKMSEAMDIEHWQTCKTHREHLGTIFNCYIRSLIGQPSEKPVSPVKEALSEIATILREATQPILDRWAKILMDQKNLVNIAQVLELVPEEKRQETLNAIFDAVAMAPQGTKPLEIAVLIAEIGDQTQKRSQDMN